jgi:DNA-binding MarR family transcriptional regulator
MSKSTLATKDELAQSLIESITSVSRHLRTVKLPEGMTRERLATLSLIHENGPVSVSDLAAMAKVRGPTMSRMTSSLVQDGLARRQVHKSDGRGVLISLTGKGQRVLKAANEKSQEHLRYALEGLSKQQVTALTALLGALEKLKPDAPESK